MVPRCSGNHVKIRVLVKETGRKLCTLRLIETDTLAFLKDEIVNKTRSAMVKNLFITEEQCHSRILRLQVEGSWDLDLGLTLGDCEMRRT